MTAAEAIEILRQHNAWRRGAETPQGDPKEIGIAIDVLCDAAELSARGRQAWADVPDASQWVDELRGGGQPKPRGRTI